MKMATVALVVGDHSDLLEIISDEREIAVFEKESVKSSTNPLQKVWDYRAKQIQEENNFADYVEELITKPFQKPEVKEHGIQWLKSRIRIEQFQRTESEAAQIIAKFALDVYIKDREKTDFFLKGPTTQVRVKVFVVEKNNFISKVA